MYNILLPCALALGRVSGLLDLPLEPLDEVAVHHLLELHLLEDLLQTVVRVPVSDDETCQLVEITL